MPDFRITLNTVNSLLLAVVCIKIEWCN